MDFVDIVYYINLDYRIDRKDNFLKWILKSGFPLNKTHRISALYNNKGYIGCTMSHIKALETFINSNHKNCIIFEDDYEPLDVYNYWNNIKKIKDNEVEFNIILLSYNDSELQISDSKHDFLKNVLFTYTASGYLINKDFAYVLLENFKECLTLCLEEEKITNRNTEQYCIDVYWKKLMKQYLFYCFYPRLGKQIESFSDILNKIVDYKC